MAHTTEHPGSWSFSIQRERIEVTSLSPRPDEAWRFTDAAGHEHFWRDGYPTLVSVAEEAYWCEDCHDEHEESHLACAICGEEIVPRLTGPSMFPEYIDAPVTISDLVYDDGLTRKTYIVETSADAQSLVDGDDREATLARIARTQKPVKVQYGNR